MTNISLIDPKNDTSHIENIFDELRKADCFIAVYKNKQTKQYNYYYINMDTRDIIFALEAAKHAVLVEET